MYGQRQFNGSLILPLINNPNSGAGIPIVPPPSTTLGGTEYFYMDTGAASAGSFQVNVNNIGVAATTKSAPYAVAATGAIQTTLTWTDVVNANGQGSLGNSVTVALIGGGTAGSEVITVTGSAIVAKIQSGTSTFTQVRTALNASTPAAALATFAGTSASTMTYTGTLATLTVQTSLVLTAVYDPNGIESNGNNITLALVAGGTAGSEIVTVTGNAISVLIAAGTSTITQVRTAMQASTPCTALVTTTGTSATAMTALAATNLAGGLTGVVSSTGGVDSSFAAGIVAGNSVITVGSTAALWEGELIRTPATSGTLPTGLGATTNYYVFVSSATTFQLFDTLAHALLAIATYNNSPAPSTAPGLIAITVDGTVGGSTLVTPTAMGATTYQIQGSNDFIPYPDPAVSTTPINTGNWVELTTGESPAGIVSNTITTTGSSMLSFLWPKYKYTRIAFSVASGSLQVQVIGHMG